MELVAKNRLIALVTAMILTCVNASYPTLAAGTAPTTFIEDINSIPVIKLKCIYPGNIHIIDFQFDRSNFTNGSSCNPREPAMDSCEGSPNSCIVALYNIHYNCTKINRVNVTFQCATEMKVMSICQGLTKTATSLYPVYLTTPLFTIAYGKYSSYTDCQCHAVPSPYNAVSIKLLYAKLETMFAPNGCYDYFSIGASGSGQTKYCKKGLMEPDINKTYLVDSPVSIRFFSDSSSVRRGGWLTISPAVPGGVVTVTCGYPTTTSASTPIPWYLRTTTDSWSYDDYDYGLSAGAIGAIVGGCIGVFIFVTSIIAVISVYIARKGAINRLANQGFNYGGAPNQGPPVYYQGRAPPQYPGAGQPAMGAAESNPGDTTATEPQVGIGYLPPAEHTPQPSEHAPQPSEHAPQLSDSSSKPK